MRVAAGVILIISAVINLFAAFSYFAVGGVGKMASSGSNVLGQAMADAEKKQGREMNAEEKASMAQMDAAAGKIGSSSGALMGFGGFLFVTVGTSIAGAVCLFRRKAVKFIFVAAALAIAAEVLSWVVFSAVLGVPLGAGKIILSIFGLLGGLFGILGARQIQAMSAEPAGMPPAAAPM